MKNVLRSIIAVGVFSIATPALSLELTNLESSERSVVIVENGNEKTYVIANGETIKDICNSDCIVRFDDGQEFSMVGNEKATIEDGFIYVEDDGALGEKPDLDQAESGMEKEIEQGDGPDQDKVTEGYPDENNKANQ